jgi:hypothetical protein
MKTRKNDLPADAIALPPRYPDRPLDQAAEKWWVAKVKPRQEKQLAQDFYKEDIEYYLPLSIKNTPRTGSKTPRLFHVPLFPGYISFAQEKPHNIFSTGRVVTIIEVIHQQRFIRELNQIYNLLKGNAPLEPVAGNLTDGTPMQIIQGPFAGAKGIIYKSLTPSTIILSVDCLGNAALKIDRSWLKEIDAADK